MWDILEPPHHFQGFVLCVYWYILSMDTSGVYISFIKACNLLFAKPLPQELKIALRDWSTGLVHKQTQSNV